MLRHGDKVLFGKSVGYWCEVSWRLWVRGQPVIIDPRGAWELWRP